MATPKKSRREFLRQTAALGSVWAIGSPSLASGAQTEKSAESSVSKKPNFLVIVADDMGFSDAGCYGGEIATPNLDRLAAGGVRFTQGYSTGRCWPSRTALLTGYYPQQVRMDPQQPPVPVWTRVVPHYLKPQGYRCYTSGKWHLNGAPKGIADGGFDRSYILHDHNHFFSSNNHELDDQKLPPTPDGKYYVTTGIAQYAIDFLKEHQEKHRGEPFYSYLAFICPHFPIQALPEDIARYRGKYDEGWDVVRERRWKRLREMGIVNCALSQLEPDVIPSWNFSKEQLLEMLGPGEVDRALPWNGLTSEQREFQAIKMAIHAAMIDRMDREIGRVLDQIKAMGEFDNTVIFFVSDNGASAEQIVRGDMNDKAAPPGSAKSYLCLGPGWSSSSNSPFRLHKHWTHEGGIASPLIVHWPAGLAARGELRHDPCHFIDLLLTLLDLSGVREVSPQWKGATAPPLPGKSLVPAFAKDGVVTRDCLYFHHQGNRALRVGDWKVVSKGANGPWELYDLKTDRCESKNLADKYPDRIREMTGQWQRLDDEFRRQAGPPPVSAKKGKKERKK